MEVEGGERESVAVPSQVVTVPIFRQVSQSEFINRGVGLEIKSVQ